MRVFYVFLIILLGSLSVYTKKVRAEPGYIPERMQGLWAVPDCATPERFAYHSITHVLYITDHDAMLQSLRLKNEGPDYAILETSDKKFPFILHDDGILEIAILVEGLQIAETDLWSELPIDQRREYMHCSRDIPDPHYIALTALPLLDILEQYCLSGSARTCQNRVFRYFDHDNNQKISIEEGIEASLISLYLSAHLAGDPVDNSLTDKLLEDGYKETATYMNMIMRFAGGYNATGLSFDDLYGLDSSLPDSISSHPVFKAQQSILRAYPLLKE